MQLVVLANSPDDAASFGDFVMTNGRISPLPDMVLCTDMITFRSIVAMNAIVREYRMTH